MSHSPPDPRPAPPWAEVRALFESLLERTPAERQHALQAADPTLAAEVRELLAQHAAEEQAPTQFLARPVRMSETQQHLHGQRLGPWKLSAPLGEGGMGEVWEAQRDDGAYEARVAVKLLPVGLDSPERQQLVQQEVRALARLNHPHIARLLDAGQTDDGQPYFVMEAVDGRPLDEACRGLPLARRLQMFLQLTDAVSHAHRQGLVHRDLKPANVLVTAEGQIKLLDFGIAQALDLTHSEQGDISRALTPGYASPEQVRGERVTAASDVYALGVLLFLLVTGVRPYGRGTTTAADALRAVLDETPTRPSVAPLASDRDPGVPRRQLRGDLDAVVLKALAKDVGGRYGSVEALSTDLRAVLEQRPVSARPHTPAYVTSRFVARHRGAVLASLLALVAVVAALGATAFQARDAAAGLALAALAVGAGVSSWQARLAARARDDARDQLAQTNGLVREVLMRYADMATFLPGGLRIKSDLLTDAIAHLERLHVAAPGDGELAAELAKAHARLADLTLPGLDTSLEDGPRCREHAERALALFPAGEAAQQERADFFMWWARAMRCRAKLLRLDGRATEALDAYQRLRRFLQSAVRRVPGSYELRFERASSLLGLAMTLDTTVEPSLGRSEQALEVLGEASQAYDELLAERPSDGDVLFQRGTVQGARMIALKHLGRVQEALAAGRQAVAAREAALAVQPNNTSYRDGVAGESNNLTMNLLDAGCVDEALAVSARGEALVRELEAEDPSVPTWAARRRWFALHRGRALLAAGQAAEAVPRLEEALLAMPEPVSGPTVARRALAEQALARAREARAADPPGAG